MKKSPRANHKNNQGIKFNKYLSKVYPIFKDNDQEDTSHLLYTGPQNLCPTDACYIHKKEETMIFLHVPKSKNFLMNTTNMYLKIHK